MADEQAPPIETQAPVAEAPVAPPTVELPDLPVPEMPQAQPQGETEGAKLIRELIENQKAASERLERIEKASRRDPLLEPDPVTDNKEVPEYVKKLLEDQAEVRRMLKEQKTIGLEQMGSAVCEGGTQQAKNLCEQWAADPSAKLFAHKPEAKALVVQQATDRIKNMLASSTQNLVRQGRDPRDHGITPEVARAIFVQTYNDINQIAKMFGGPQQVAQQVQVNQNSGVPAGGGVPEMSNAGDQEPDPVANRQGWLDHHARLNAVLAPKYSR